MAAGGVASSASPDFTVAELEYQLKDCDAKILLTSVERLEVACEAAKRSGCVREIVTFNDRRRGFACFADLLEDDGGCDPGGGHEMSEEDTAAILYFSGTTGLPKGVELSHRNLVSNVQQYLACVEQGSDERLLGMLPLYHVFGQVAILAVTFSYGYEISILSKFHPIKFMETLQNHRLTNAHMVPPVVQFMIHHPAVSQFDLSSLRRIVCAAAPLRRETEDAFREKFRQIDLLQGWGMTELSPVGALTPLKESKYRLEKPGSVGILLPNTEYRVIDTETGRDVPAGAIGEILVRGPGVMKGYHRNREATEQVIDSDGWFSTGDVGHIDSDGYMYISDRLKELIKVKGLQVAPAELEGLLLTCPMVSDAAVIGVADDRLGEVPAAFVVARPNAEGVTEAAVQAWVADRAANHKRLAGGVRFVEAIPRAASGKILRRQLKEMMDSLTH